MAAKAKPMAGDRVPDGASAKDVKHTDDSSSSDQESRLNASSEESSESSDSSESSESSSDLDESDLEEIEKEAKRVPYQRFKEVNDKAKTLESQLEEFSTRYETDLRRATEDAELRIRARLEREQSTSVEDLDPETRERRELKEEIHRLKNELGSLKGETSQDRVQAKMERLKTKYPDADELAVLGWWKHNPRLDLEEAMEKSHQQFNEKLTYRYREMIEKKKAKAKAAVPSREGGIRLKESDRPKTIAAANAAMRKFFGGSG